MFNIGESRTISHPNDTELQAQQVPANPCQGRFSTETPLEIMPMKISFTIFITTIPSKIHYHCIAALYINTAVSFKSSITKIYYCWPPIFDPM